MSCNANCITGSPWIIEACRFPLFPMADGETLPLIKIVNQTFYLQLQSTYLPSSKNFPSAGSSSLSRHFLRIIFQPILFQPYNFWSKKFFSLYGFTQFSESSCLEFPFSVWIFWPLSLNVRNVLYKTLVLLCIFVACLFPFLLFFSIYFFFMVRIL